MTERKLKCWPIIVKATLSTSSRNHFEKPNKKVNKNRGIFPFLVLLYYIAQEWRYYTTAGHHFRIAFVQWFFSASLYQFGSMSMLNTHYKHQTLPLSVHSFLFFSLRFFSPSRDGGTRFRNTLYLPGRLASRFRDARRNSYRGRAESAAGSCRTPSEAIKS